MRLKHTVCSCERPLELSALKCEAGPPAHRDGP